MCLVDFIVYYLAEDISVIVCLVDFIVYYLAECISVS